MSERQRSRSDKSDRSDRPESTSLFPSYPGAARSDRSDLAGCRSDPGPTCPSGPTTVRTARPEEYQHGPTCPTCPTETAATRTDWPRLIAIFKPAGTEPVFRSERPSDPPPSADLSTLSAGPFRSREPEAFAERLAALMADFAASDDPFDARAWR